MFSSEGMAAICLDAASVKNPAFAAALNISSPMLPRYAPEIIFSKICFPGSSDLASIATSNFDCAIFENPPDSEFTIISTG